MGILLKTVGFGGTNDPVVKRAVGILSDGSAVMMVNDMNQTSVTGDGGDATGVPKMYFYHSTDRVTWTLKLTVNYPGATAQNTVSSMCVDSANNIHVAYRWSNGNGPTVNYVKLTFAAGPVWTAGTHAVLNTTPPSGYNSMSLLDIDTIGNLTDCVVIGAYWYQPTGSKKTAFQSYVKATTGGAWVTHPLVVTISGDSHLGYADDMTICGDNIGGLTSGTTGYFAWYVTRKGAAGTDFGDVLYVTEVNTSSGAWMSRKLIQGGLYKGAGGGFRKFWLFNTAANQYTLAGVVDVADFKTAIYRFSYNRSTAVATNVTPITTSPGRGTSLWRRTNNHNWAGVAYNGSDELFFFANGNGQAVVGAAKISGATVSFDAGYHKWDNAYGYPAGTWDSTGKFVAPTVAYLEQIHSGATRNWGTARIDAMLFHHRDSGAPQSWRMEARSLLVPKAPDGITPAASATVTTDRPSIGANIRLQTYYPQLRVKSEWQIASDAGFTTNLRTITEPDSDFEAATGTSSPYNAIVKHGEVLNAIQELTQGTWYIRARTQDYSGNFGPYSSSTTFTVTHPPVGVNLYPTAGKVFLYAGVGNVTFTWKFTDPSPYDNQSAYQIVVENAQDGSVVADSGKVISTAQSATIAIPVGGKDIDLRWKMKLWDSDDVVGPETPYQVFYVTDPPAPAITSPANGAVLSSGIPTVSWTSGIGGTKTQERYRVLLTQGVNVIYNSNWVDSADTSHTFPVGYFRNDQQYTIRVEVQDNLGLQGFAEISVSTDWVEPLGPANDWEVYLNEYAKRGFVYITWTDANMDPDFSSWSVYRRQRGDSTWTQIATVTSGAGRYAYRDYFVGSGRTYEYTITQMVDRFGDLIESIPTKIVRVAPDADNYWLIDPVVPSQSIPLHTVTADPFTEEYEQETTHIIGAGRHVEYGDRLGYSGTISSSLRDKFVSGLVRENYALNPAMSYQSVNGADPDKWTLVSGTQSTILSDMFTRTVVDGLGPGWTFNGGAATNYDVDGSKAVITMTAKGVEYYMIPTMSAVDDFDVTFLVQSPDMTGDAASNNPNFNLWARYVDANNYLKFKVWFTNGGITVNINQRVGGGSETNNGSFPPIATPGTAINTPVWIRVQGSGSTARMMGWIDGSPAPSAWNVEWTVTHVAAGTMMFSGNMPAAYSGTAPKTFTLDNVTIISVPTLGEVSSGYYETRNPSPSGKTPYRVYASSLGPDANGDNVRLEQQLMGSDLPDKMKVPGTTIILSVWVATSSLNVDKRYRLSIGWLDGTGGQTGQVDSTAYTGTTDSVDSYIPASSIDAAAGNATQVWRRLYVAATVPGTPPSGIVLKVRLMGNGGAPSPGELIVGGAQFETAQITEYFDGDQFGGDWSGEPYLSYSYGTGYYTARQQRQALERIKGRKTWVYLRNPFGDLWKVAPGNIAIQRIAGVGKSEFVNVTMPYEEVDS